MQDNLLSLTSPMSVNRFGFIDNGYLKTSLVPDLPYRNLVWLTYRLAAVFSFGLPLVLLAWAAIRQEKSMVRLLTIYWKIASLLGISILLLVDQRPIGYITLFVAPLLMVASIWFWIDLNEELADLPPWRPLPFTVRIWRWCISGFALVVSPITFLSLSCATITEESNCKYWLEAPRGFHRVAEKLFGFLFGGEWTQAVSAFIGYLALMAYLIGLIQLLLIRLPRQGRIAGEF